MALFQDAQTIEIAIEGMHCEKCVARVTQALEDVDGVLEVAVSLADKNAKVRTTAQAQALIAAIENLGFQASC